MIDRLADGNAAESLSEAPEAAGLIRSISFLFFLPPNSRTVTGAFLTKWSGLNTLSVVCPPSSDYAVLSTAVTTS